MAALHIELNVQMLVRRFPCSEPMKIYTIGFTRKTAQQFFGLLRGTKASVLADIRLSNSSQLARFTVGVDLGWFIANLDGFPNWNYVELQDLAPTSEMLKTYRESSKRKACRDEAWNIYAEEYLNLLEERRAIEAVDEDLIQQGLVLLCSEVEPERCHRRLAAEQIKKQRFPECEIVHL